MKIVYVLIAVLILGGGYFFYSNDSAPTAEPVETSDVTDVSTDEPENIGEIDVVDSTMPVPAPGHEDVEEMIVTEIEEDEPEVEEEPVSEPEVVSEEHVFDVGGVNFAFDVTEMRVKEGDTVTINFTSNDGFHDWTIDEFGAATSRVQKGNSSSVTFVADARGTYEYYCSVGSHRAQGMVGTLIVE